MVWYRRNAGRDDNARCWYLIHNPSITLDTIFDYKHHTMVSLCQTHLSSLKKNSKDFESAIGEFGVVTKLPAGETYGKIRFSTPILDKDEWDFKCNDVIKLGDRLQIQEINKSYLLVSK